MVELPKQPLKQPFLWAILSPLLLSRRGRDKLPALESPLKEVPAPEGSVCWTQPPLPRTSIFSHRADRKT